MGEETQIILISHSALLEINFSYMFDVENKKIALLSLQSPNVEQSKDRSKRIYKDPNLNGGDVLPVFIHCDELRHNTLVNHPGSNNSKPLKCLDVLHLAVDHNNSIQVQNPTYHLLNSSTIMSLKIELRDNTEELVNFHSGNIVLKLGIK